MARDDYSDSSSPLVNYARKLCADRLTAYAAASHDVEEHSNIEVSVLAGGYAYRQVAELIQNAADAISESPASSGADRIEVVADLRGLWAANTGAPLDEAGVRALLNAHSSNKRAGQIGRFGLGFKSLLRLGGNIDVLSRSGCLHFNPGKARQRIREHLGMPDDAANVPGLRLAEATAWDEGLASLTGASRFDWATTIVFAELASPTARPAIVKRSANSRRNFCSSFPATSNLSFRQARCVAISFAGQRRTEQ